MRTARWKRTEAGDTDVKLTSCQLFSPVVAMPCPCCLLDALVDGEMREDTTPQSPHR